MRQRKPGGKRSTKVTSNTSEAKSYLNTTAGDAAYNNKQSKNKGKGGKRKARF
jgi:hypothetical protein